MPQQLDTGLFSIIDTDSSIGVGWKLNFYTTGTSTRKNTYPTSADASAGTNANANPVIVPADGRIPTVWFLDDADYKCILTDENDVVKETVDPINPSRISASGGSALVGFLQSGTGAVARDQQSKDRDTVSVFDFMSTSQIADVQANTALVDVTTVLQTAINEVATSGRALHFPAGTYRTTATLTINENITMFGDGQDKTIIKIFSSSVVDTINVSCLDNSSIIGFRISGMKIICNGGSAVCDGINIETTATNSAVSQSIFEDLFIINTRRGVSGLGVIYRCIFRNITVSTNVTDKGFYFDAGFIDIVYNLFEGCEVTNVQDGAHAYYIHSNFSQFINLTSDGVSRFSSPGGSINGYTQESITATTPPVTTALILDQVERASNLAFNNIPNSKCTIGIQVIGVCVVQSVRYLGAAQPNNLFFPSTGSEGVLSSISSDIATATTLIEVGQSDQATLNNWIFQDASDATNLSFVYQEGTWTPAFAAGWTTAPTVNSANYVRQGRNVTIYLTMTNGITDASGTNNITGLPFTPAINSMGRARVSNTAESFDVLILSATAAIQGSPASMTLTGDTTVLTVTYRM